MVTLDASVRLEFGFTLDYTRGIGFPRQTEMPIFYQFHLNHLQRKSSFLRENLDFPKET